MACSILCFFFFCLLQVLLANFTKVWLPAEGSTTAELLLHAEELGYYDTWAERHTVDTGGTHGVYDLFVCKDSSCGGAGNALFCAPFLPRQARDKRKGQR